MMNLSPYAVRVFEYVSDEEPISFIGGGFLRDSLLGIPARDVDIFVPINNTSIRDRILRKFPELVPQFNSEYGAMSQFESYIFEDVNVVFIPIPATFLWNNPRVCIEYVMSRWNLTCNMIAFNSQLGLITHPLYNTEEISVSSDILDELTDGGGRCYRNKQVKKFFKTIVKFPSATLINPKTGATVFVPGLVSQVMALLWDTCDDLRAKSYIDVESGLNYGHLYNTFKSIPPDTLYQCLKHSIGVERASGIIRDLHGVGP